VGAIRHHPGFRGRQLSGCQNGEVESDSPKVPWSASFPDGQASEVTLARLVDADGGNDEAEASYYEWAADPHFLAMEKQRRRFRGSLRRRLRRLDDRSRMK
jgi:hypothetical protein